jgi:hypothetical protein
MHIIIAQLRARVLAYVYHGAAGLIMGGRSRVRGWLRMSSPLSAYPHACIRGLDASDLQIRSGFRLSSC